MSEFTIIDIALNVSYNALREVTLQVNQYFLGGGNIQSPVKDQRKGALEK